MNVGNSFDSGITAHVIDGEYISNIYLCVWVCAVVQIAKIQLVK